MSASARQAEAAELHPLEIARRATIPLTDYGNAERLVLDHGADLLHVPGAGWYVWDGRRFHRDHDGAVMRRSKATVRGMREEAAHLTDADAREALWKHAERSEKRERLNAMIALAATEESVIVHADDLDRDPLLLNVQNGALDLHTGELREHRREDRITKITPVEFRADASCPRWQGFLQTVLAGDADLIEFVKRAAGYSLTGQTGEQCLFLLTGSGANGKSTLMEVLADMLGDYAVHADATTFTTQRGRGVRSDLARLQGARFVPATEVERNASFAEVLVKQATGGDRIVASFLYQNEFDFLPGFKVWIAANHLPEVRGDDDAFWRRVRRVPFDVVIERPDRELPERLRHELPGILNWAVEGCLEWRRDGLEPPAAVRTATLAYRRDEDNVGRFIRERCRRTGDASATPTALYAGYRSFCRDEGIEPIKMARFAAQLKSEGLVQERRRYEGRPERRYVGIEVTA